jgi:hypothetical protein
VTLVQLTTLKGAVVWVNPSLLLYAGLADGAGSSMYGETNTRTGTKLHFAQGVTLDVRDALEDVVAKVTAIPLG